MKVNAYSTTRLHSKLCLEKIRYVLWNKEVQNACFWTRSLSRNKVRRDKRHKRRVQKKSSPCHGLAVQKDIDASHQGRQVPKRTFHLGSPRRKSCVWFSPQREKLRLGQQGQVDSRASKRLHLVKGASDKSPRVLRPCFVFGWPVDV